MYYTPLPERSLISLAGEDTVPFLQGLISNDAAKVTAGEAVYAALLSPQGKYLHDFFLMPVAQAIWLDGEKNRMTDLLNRLALYKLRSKVTIDKQPDTSGVVAAWGGNVPATKGGEGFSIFKDPRLPELGLRLAGDVAASVEWCKAHGWKAATAEDYDRHRLTIGVPDGSRDMTVDRSFLLECGFEELHGVDFKKGCYVGQEVTARSKHRAQLRKFLYQVKSAAAELPPEGTPIMAGTAIIGEMRSHQGNIGLAMVRSEELAKAKGTPIMAGGIEITVSVARWFTLASAA